MKGRNLWSKRREIVKARGAVALKISVYRGRETIDQEFLPTVGLGDLVLVDETASWKTKKLFFGIIFGIKCKKT